MAFDLLMPKLGLTMTEGAVSEWKVQPGGAVRAGEVVLVIETDKVEFDVEAEVDGTMLEIEVPAGESVPVGARLARIGTPGEAAAAAGYADGERRVIATPLARKLAKRALVDLRSVSGSGPRGRIKADDVRTATRDIRQSQTRPGPGAAVRRRASPTQTAMARRLSGVKHGVPHFYLAAEAELSALEALRAGLNADETRPRLSVTTFIVAASGRALADLPAANSVWADGDVVTYAQVDVGVAVHAPQGLFVPVVRDVGAKSVDRIAREAGVLFERTRAGELGLEDLAGGALTVSNAGMYNVTYMTPIVNPGQSATLGVGSVRQVFRPDAAGAPALRRELGLVLAADHRIFDGVSGLQLLNRIIGYLEAPLRLLRSD